MGEASGVRKGPTQHLSSTETTRKRLQSQAESGGPSEGTEETPALPQGVGSPTAGLYPEGLWNQFSESWQALFYELDRI